MVLRGGENWWWCDCLPALLQNLHNCLPPSNSALQTSLPPLVRLSSQIEQLLSSFARTTLQQHSSTCIPCCDPHRNPSGTQTRLSQHCSGQPCSELCRGSYQNATAPVAVRLSSPAGAHTYIHTAAGCAPSRRAPPDCIKLKYPNALHAYHSSHPAKCHRRTSSSPPPLITHTFPPTHDIFNIPSSKRTITHSRNACDEPPHPPGLADWIVRSNAGGAVEASDWIHQLRDELLQIFEQSPALPSVVQTVLVDELVEQLGPLERFSFDDVDLKAAVQVLNVLHQCRHDTATTLLGAVLGALHAGEWLALEMEDMEVLALLGWIATDLCINRPAHPPVPLRLYYQLLSRTFTACLSRIEDVDSSQAVQLLACMGASRRFGSRTLLYALVHKAEQGLSTITPPSEESHLLTPFAHQEEDDEDDNDAGASQLSSLRITHGQLAFAVAAAAHLDKHNFPRFMMTAASFLAPSSHLNSVTEAAALVQHYARIGLRPKPLMDRVAHVLVQCMTDSDDALLQDPASQLPCNDGKGISAAKQLTYLIMHAESAAALQRLLSANQSNVSAVHVAAAISRSATLLASLNEIDGEAPPGESSDQYDVLSSPAVYDSTSSSFQASDRKPPLRNASGKLTEASQLHRLLRQLELNLMDQLAQHSATGLAVVVWQWGRAHYSPSRQLLESVIVRIVQQAGPVLKALTAKELVMLMSGLASLDTQLDSKVWEFLVPVTTARAAELTVSERVHLYWSVARVASDVGLPHKHRNMLRNVLLVDATPQLSQLQRAELMQLLNALMELRHRVPGLVERVGAQLASHMEELTTQEICHVAYCIARLNPHAVPTPEPFQKAALQQLQIMSPTDIGKLCWVMRHPLQQKVASSINRLQQRAMQLLPWMTPQSLCEMLALSAEADAHHYELFKRAAVQLMSCIPAPLPAKPVPAIHNSSSTVGKDVTQCLDTL